MSTHNFAYIWSVCLIVTASRYTYFVHSQRAHQIATFQNAFNTCTGKGERLPNVKQARSNMELWGLKNIWLRMKRFDFKLWYWIDGKESSEGNIMRQSPTYSCAAIRGTDIYAFDCFTKLKGFLCQSACNICDKYDCETINGICVFAVERVADWYSALTFCRNMGANLTKTIAFPDRLKRRLGQEEFWIGLAKSFWTRVDTSNEEVMGRVSLEYQWGHDLETNIESRCAVLDVISNLTKPMDCFSSHAFICINDTGSRTSKHVTADVSPGNMGILFIGLGTSAFFVVMAIALFLIQRYDCLQRCCPKPSKGDKVLRSFWKRNNSYIDMSGAFRGVGASFQTRELPVSLGIQNSQQPSQSTVHFEPLRHNYRRSMSFSGLGYYDRAEGAPQDWHYGSTELYTFPSSSSGQEEYNYASPEY